MKLKRFPKELLMHVLGALLMTYIIVTKFSEFSENIRKNSSDLFYLNGC